MNLCVTFSWKLAATDTRVKYGVICPADNSAATTWIATGKAAVLGLSAFSVPFYVGANSDSKKTFINSLAFVWTGLRGLVLTYNT